MPGDSVSSSGSTFLSSSELSSLTEIINAFLNNTDEASNDSSNGGCSSCGGDSGGDSGKYKLDGEVSNWGDPHHTGDVKVNGNQVNFDYVTEGGSGDEINLLDTDTIDIVGKFDDLQGEADGGVTYTTEQTVTLGSGSKEVELEFDADDDSVTMNGEKLEDGCYEKYGNKITVDGGKVTIETADGQKIVIDDKGNYLDTEVTFNDYETDTLGGQIGDAVNSNVNDNSEDYVVDSDSSSSSSDSTTAFTQEQWDQLMSGLSGLYQDNPMLSEFLAGLPMPVEQNT